MTTNGFQLPLTEVPTLALPVDEPARWPVGSGVAKRRLGGKTRRRAREAAREAAKRRAGTFARRRAAAVVETEDHAQKDADGHPHDGAMSRASGWFFMPPPG